MKDLIIIYSRFIREDGGFHIGGIETYIHQLIEAFKNDYSITVVFPTKTKSQVFRLDGYNVVSITDDSNTEIKKYIEKSFNPKFTKVLIATEQINLKFNEFTTIVIQHGIYWDLPIKLYRSGNFQTTYLFKIWDNILNLKRIAKFSKVVCVDYNYLNWRRCLLPKLDESNYFVIPNCASSPFFSPPTEKGRQRILFARRFVKLRGVYLFGKVMSELLNEYNDLEITIAGSGPEEKGMKEILPLSGRVRYVEASYEEMPSLVKEHDIVVIPSLGSEGTSLSAIEGMAAGKIVLATNVGGLTNILIDGFNGFLCKPTEDSLKSYMNKILLMDQSELLMIRKNAYNVAMASFSFKKWKDKWKVILE